jgi:hypothetical protein
MRANCARLRAAIKQSSTAPQPQKVTLPFCNVRSKCDQIKAGLTARFAQSVPVDARPRRASHERERGHCRPKVRPPEVECIAKGKRTNLTSSESRRALPTHSSVRVLALAITMAATILLRSFRASSRIVGKIIKRLQLDAAIAAMPRPPDYKFRACLSQALLASRILIPRVC